MSTYPEEIAALLMFDFAAEYRIDPATALDRATIFLLDDDLAQARVTFLKEMMGDDPPAPAELEPAVELVASPGLIAAHASGRLAEQLDRVAAVFNHAAAFVAARQRVREVDLDRIVADALTAALHPPDEPAVVEASARARGASGARSDIRVPNESAVVEGFAGAADVWRRRILDEAEQRFRPDERRLRLMYRSTEAVARRHGGAIALDRAGPQTRADVLRLLAAENTDLTAADYPMLVLIACRAGTSQLSAVLIEIAVGEVVAAVHSSVRSMDHDPPALGAWAGCRELALSDCVSVLRAVAGAADAVRPYLAPYFTGEYAPVFLDARHADGWEKLNRLLARAATADEALYRECAWELFGHDTVTEWVCRGGPDSGAPPDRAVLHQLLAGRVPRADSG